MKIKQQVKNILFHNIFNISLTSRVQLHIYLLIVVDRIIFSSILQIWCVEVRISRSISDSLGLRDSESRLYAVIATERVVTQLVFRCLGKAVLHDCVLSLTLRKHAYSNTLKILPPKNDKFSDKTFWYFSYFCSKHRLRVLVRTASSRRF